MCSSAYWPEFLSVGEMLQTSRDIAEVYERFELRSLPALNVCRSNKPWRIAALSGIALSGELHLFQDMVSKAWIIDYKARKHKHNHADTKLYKETTTSYRFQKLHQNPYVMIYTVVPNRVYSRPWFMNSDWMQLHSEAITYWYIVWYHLQKLQWKQYVYVQMVSITSWNTTIYTITPYI